MQDYVNIIDVETHEFQQLVQSATNLCTQIVVRIIAYSINSDFHLNRLGTIELSNLEEVHKYIYVHMSPRQHEITSKTGLQQECILKALRHLFTHSVQNKPLHVACWQQT